MIEGLSESSFSVILECNKGKFPNLLPEEVARLEETAIDAKKLKIINSKSLWSGLYNKLCATSALVGMVAPNLIFYHRDDKFPTGHFYGRSGTIILEGNSSDLSAEPFFDFIMHHEFGHGLQSYGGIDAPEFQEFHADAVGALRTSTNIARDFFIQAEINDPKSKSSEDSWSEPPPPDSVRIAYLTKREESQTWQEFVRGKRPISELYDYVIDNVCGRF